MSTRAIGTKRLIIGLAAGLAALLAAGVVTVASANPGNGLRTRTNSYEVCTASEARNSPPPGQLERFNQNGYVYYGSFCDGGELVVDLDGNPIRSDAPAPGVVMEWVNGTVIYRGVYHGDRRIDLAGDGEDAWNGPVTYSENTRAGTVLYEWTAFHWEWAGHGYPQTHRVIVGDDGVPYQETLQGQGGWLRAQNPSIRAVFWASDDGEHRAIVDENGLAYREERIGGLWVRSAAYDHPLGLVHENRSTIWNAYYRCQGGALQSMQFWLDPLPLPTDCS